MENKKIDFLIDNMNELSINLTEIQIHQFLKYYELLIDWNKIINLTTITEFEDVVIKHFIDSITLSKAVDLSNRKTIIDIGTGAGFPGIPLKILFPNLEITLMDSLNKRVNFLNNVIDELDLEGIYTLHGRAEDYAKDTKYREQYDFGISRAVANLSTLSEYCLPYIKLEGLFISYKSGKIQEESTNADRAIKLLGGEFNRQVDFTLGNSNFYRNLYIIKKTSKTNMKYPRKAGLPNKNPL